MTTDSVFRAGVFAGALALVGLLPALAGNAANPDAIELQPIPMPAEMSSDMDHPVPFGPETTVTVACPDAEGAAWIRRHFGDWYGARAPKVVAGGGAVESLPANAEAYSVVADASGVKIAARTLAGVRWAAYTIRPLVIAKRGDFKTTGYVMPTLKVTDAPKLAFRAVHLCWLAESRVVQMERAIRLAAMMKFNYAIIESWGQYRSAKHPWWGWANGTMTKAEVRRLAAIGRDLGITLVPQVNVFGHASLARVGSIKHSVLDIHPEYEPLFEPGGWNWCLSNPEAQRVLRELIAEMHEDFGNPPYFHLGCDEAQPPCCPSCRKRPYGDLVCEHIAGLAEFVRKRGARAMIWHDMLLKRGAPEWKNFEAKGTDATVKLVDRLPKDVVICDWEYSYCDFNETRRDWPTIAYFKEKGFPVVGCPWLNFNSMKPMSDFLVSHGGFGYIQTTWHHLRGYDWRAMYAQGATAAWGCEKPYKAPTMLDTHVAIPLRFVGLDMKLTDPRDTGIVDYQVPPAWWIND